MGRGGRSPFAVVLPFLAILGCAVGPDFVPPQPPISGDYSPGGTPPETAAADDLTQTFHPGAPVVAEWWRLFGNESLDARIAEAIAQSPTLQAALASLRGSQDSLRAGYGVFLPQIDAGASAVRERSFFPASGGSSTFNLYTLAGTVSYTLDVFGGERRAVESLAAQAEAQDHLAAATYLTLLGNVVNATIAEAAYEAEIEATRRLVAEQRDQAEIATAQAEAGTATYIGAYAIATQLAATEASLPPLQQRLAQTQHLLATLLGREPADWTSPPVELSGLDVPGDLPVTLPSELVRRRPDILAAEAQLHQASAEIGVATAAMFPSITLGGGYGWNSNSVAEMFVPQSHLWNIAAGLTAPLFHGGSLWYQRRAAIDAYEQAFATYRQTALSGLQQVADALDALQHDARQLAAQSRQLEAAREELRLTKLNYGTGLLNYLDVVVVNAQYDQATIAYIGAKAQRLQDTVALFVALGGGWWSASGESSPCEGERDS